MEDTIVLLDVDGVLIHALGYRASVKATVEYFARRMGQSHITGPQDADMLAFEAQSIIFEWDSTAICIASLLQQAPELHADTLDDTLHNIAQAGVQLQQPDYASIARQCPPSGDGLKPGPAALGTMFPKTPVYTEVLANTHDTSAPITQFFQQFVLGHEQFARTYHCKPQLETLSMLETYDVPLLTPATCDRLYDTEHLYPTMYTARPSLPPTFVDNWLGYSPEAEIAQKLLGMTQSPVIGYGRVQWLAQQHSVPTSTYVKPSAMHALVAIFSAILYGTPDGEGRAFRLATGEETIPDDLKARPWRVIVCEDSTGGIRGVRQAVQQLTEQHEVSFTAVGIAKAPENVQALQPIADYVAEDVNAGLAWVLGEY